MLNGRRAPHRTRESSSHPAALLQSRTRAASRITYRRHRSRYLTPLTLSPSCLSPIFSSLSILASLSLLNHHPALQLRERRVIIIALRACTDGPSEGCGEMYSHMDQCIATMPLSVQGYTNPRICTRLATLMQCYQHLSS
jgi:hypothetical protein